MLRCLLTVLLLTPVQSLAITSSRSGVIVIVSIVINTIVINTIVIIIIVIVIVSVQSYHSCSGTFNLRDQHTLKIIQI